MSEWKNERPNWCPEPTCRFMVSSQGCVCVGRLPYPRRHADDYNTHNFCIYKSIPSDPGDGVFSLEINRSDAYSFQRLLEAVRSDEEAYAEYRKLFTHQRTR